MQALGNWINISVNISYRSDCQQIISINELWSGHNKLIRTERIVTDHTMKLDEDFKHPDSADPNTSCDSPGDVRRPQLLQGHMTTVTPEASHFLFLRPLSFTNSHWWEKEKQVHDVIVLYFNHLWFQISRQLILEPADQTHDSVLIPETLTKVDLWLRQTSLQLDLYWLTLVYW